MYWKEKIDFPSEMFTKKEILMQKGMIKLVKLYEKNRILELFLNLPNDILKSWDRILSLCVELLNICTEFLNMWWTSCIEFIR